MNEVWPVTAAISNSASAVAAKTGKIKVTAVIGDAKHVSIPISPDGRA